MSREILIKILRCVRCLLSMFCRSQVAFTPAGDYDDSYILQFAMNHGACIVSNDNYRDALGRSLELSVRRSLGQCRCVGASSRCRVVGSSRLCVMSYR